MVSKKLLLVEGINDQSFFAELCKAHGLEAEVLISEPKKIGGGSNGKRGAINHLPVLLAQLADGSREKVALVVDADQVASGGGFDATVQLVIQKIEPFGFDAAYTTLPNGGVVFSHPDGLADFGLWVMPNNQDEGILENWVLQSVATDEIDLLSSAKASVNALENPKFKQVRAPKAEVATWLAWQEKPGEGLYYTVKGNLLNKAAPLYTGLSEWLLRLFA